MSQKENSSPEIDRARDLEIQAQIRKEKRVLRSEIGRYENDLESQQNRDIAAGRTQSSLPGTSVEKVTKLNAKRIHFESQAALIQRKEQGLIGRVLGSHSTAAKSSKKLNTPVTSALKNSTIWQHQWIHR